MQKLKTVLATTLTGALFGGLVSTAVAESGDPAWDSNRLAVFNLTMHDGDTGFRALADDRFGSGPVQFALYAEFLREDAGPWTWSRTNVGPGISYRDGDNRFSLHGGVSFWELGTSGGILGGTADTFLRLTAKHHLNEGVVLGGSLINYFGDLDGMVLSGTGRYALNDVFSLHGELQYGLDDVNGDEPRLLFGFAAHWD